MEAQETTAEILIQMGVRDPKKYSIISYMKIQAFSGPRCTLYMVQYMGGIPAARGHPIKGASTETMPPIYALHGR